MYEYINSTIRSSFYANKSEKQQQGFRNLIKSAHAKANNLNVYEAVWSYLSHFHVTSMSQPLEVSNFLLLFLGVQPPTAASLLNQLNPSPYTQNAPAANPALLQALMNQNSAPAQAVPPIPQPQVQQPVSAGPGGNTNQLANQIAQLLQGRGGVDPNALNALIKPEGNSQSAAKPPAQNGNYSTSYPASSTYDMYYNQNNAQNTNNYGPSKEEGDSKRYRPY